MLAVTSSPSASLVQESPSKEDLAISEVIDGYVSRTAEWQRCYFEPAKSHLVQPIIKRAVEIFRKNNKQEVRELFDKLTLRFKEKLSYDRRYFDQVATLAVQMSILVEKVVLALVRELEPESLEKDAIDGKKEAIECKVQSSDSSKKGEAEDYIKSALANVFTKKEASAFLWEDSCLALVRDQFCYPMIMCTVKLYEENLTEEGLLFFNYLIKRAQKENQLRSDIQTILAIKIGLLLRLDPSFLLEKIELLLPSWKKDLVGKFD